MRFILPAFALLLAACGHPASDSVVDSASRDTVPVSKDSALSLPTVIDTVKSPTGKALIGPGDEETSEIMRQVCPVGYDIMDSMTGDLNRDQYLDMLLILRDSSDEVRELLILTGDGKTYSVVARNRNAVLCYDCGGIWGDPYEGLAIKNGYFSIEHYGGSSWRWTRIITFKYNKEKNDWFLHRDAGVEFNIFEEESQTEGTYNEQDFGKVRFGEYDYNK